MINFYKNYIIKMPDGSKWSVPVSVIAENRADYYAHEFDGGFRESLNDDTIPLFDDPDEIEDWAKGNMDWSDVKRHATQCMPSEVDLENGWCNGEVEISGEKIN